MNFKNFTKMNQVVKAAKFELVPCGATRDFLELHNVIESDTTRKNSISLVKEITDDFIRKYLSTFKNADYDWNSLEKLTGAPEYRSASEKVKEVIAADVTKKFAAYINEFAQSNEITNSISWPSADFIETLLPIYVAKSNDFNNAKYTDALKSLEKASTALFRHHFVRYNLMLSGTKHGSVAERVYENFNIFLYNKALFEKYEECLALNGDYSYMFSNADNMNTFVSQTGIDKYNTAIGAEYNESGECITEGLNQIVNKYNQNHPDSKIPLFKQMYKQILIESASAFDVAFIDNEHDFKEKLNCFHTLSLDIVKDAGEFIGAVKKENSLQNIYVTVACKRDISNSICGEWNYVDNIQTLTLSDNIRQKYLTDKGKAKASLTQKDEAEIRREVNTKALSIAELNKMLSENGFAGAQHYFACLYEKYCDELKESYKRMANSNFWNKEVKPQWEENKFIQGYIDSALAIANIVQNFVTDITRVDCDVTMAEQVDKLQAERKELNKLYNMIRNYLTKKPEQDAKKKSAQLMFGRPNHLVQAWQNKQAGKFGNPDAAILEYDGKFYYMVSAAEKQKLAIPIVERVGKKIGVEYYNYLSTKKNVKLSMALPRQTFASKKALELYKAAKYDDEEFEIPVGNSFMTVSKRLYNDYATKTFRQDSMAKNALINYAKDFIMKDNAFKEYDFSSLKDANEYLSYGEFCDAVDAIAFKVEGKYISKAAVDAGVNEGRLYLFLIKNQDMYKPREKCKDKTALRFRAVIERIFDGDNSIILNNAPQIVYRPAVIEKRDVHPVESVLVNKLTSDGHKIPEEEYREIYEYYNGRCATLSESAAAYINRVITKKSDFSHIKDAHYTREMFTITITYTINKGVASPVSGYELNKRVLENMKADGYNVMAVIRGTDNLLYYRINKQDGTEIKSGDLNTVGGVNYLERLNLLGSERHERQKNWDYKMEDKVAKTKDQYLSQICNEIAKIAIENNAVIIVDLLSMKAKSKAPGFDDKVYAKFEERLVRTLSDYCNTAIPDKEPGGVINPIQLATADNLKGYQNGIVFFVSTAMTRNICPDTGFVNILSTRNICTLSAKRKCLESMNAIRFNKDCELFEFEFSFDKIGSYFTQDKIPTNINKIWTIKTTGTRKNYDIQKHRYDVVSTETLTECLSDEKDALDKNGVIDAAKLSNKAVNIFYSVFSAYLNGYGRNEQGVSVYISPITGWSNIGKISYDAMTTEVVLRKGNVMIAKLLEGKKGSEAVVITNEWYDILTM